MSDQPVEDLLRELAPQVLGILVRRHGQLRRLRGRGAGGAAGRRPAVAGRRRAGPPTVLAGRPSPPAGWWTSGAARAPGPRREEAVAALAVEPGPTGGPGRHADPALPLLPPGAVAAVAAGADPAGRRRADHRGDRGRVPGAGADDGAADQPREEALRGARFALPPPAELPDRLRVVLHVLYLVFNEGYTASSGPAAQRADLTAEAVRLTRLVHALVPGDGEVAGLLALMLLTDARRPARTDADRAAGPAGRAGPLPLGRPAGRGGGGAGRPDAGPGPGRAVPAAGGDRRPARRGADRRRTPTGRRSSPSTTCCCGSRPGRWSPSTGRWRWRWCTGRWPGWPCSAPWTGTTGWRAATGSTRSAAHLLEMAGDPAGARAAYRRALRRTASGPEQHYLALRAARLA